MGLDARRQRYLEAMGIQSWVPRNPELSEPVMEQAVPLAPPAANSEPVAATPPVAEAPVPVSTIAVETPVAVTPAIDELAGLDWGALQQRVSSCQACGLAQSRTQTVFGVGNQNADLLVIGEAPGADEDAQGEPFVGRAGQLLNAMLQAIGLKRETVYIANILKCRPPNNRDPAPEEVAACEGYLRRQIELLQPKVILCVGRIAAHNLLKTEEALGRLRGQQLSYGEQRIPVVVTYHPSYLLRTPQDKAKAWQDLLRLKALGVVG